MFTGIVQAVATIAAIQERPGLRTFTLAFPEGFCHGLAIGASVATDGVCLTVTDILSPTQARFDVMQHSLAITTLGGYRVGQRVNVERAAKEGAEVGGHILSGHVDGTAQLLDIVPTETNYKIRFSLPPRWPRMCLPKAISPSTVPASPWPRPTARPAGLTSGSSPKPAAPPCLRTSAWAMP